MPRLSRRETEIRLIREIAASVCGELARREEPFSPAQIHEAIDLEEEHPVDLTFVEMVIATLMSPYPRDPTSIIEHAPGGLYRVVERSRAWLQVFGDGEGKRILDARLAVIYSLMDQGRIEFIRSPHYSTPTHFRLRVTFEDRTHPPEESDHEPVTRFDLITEGE